MSYPSLNIIYNKLPSINGQVNLLSREQTTNDIINAVISQHNKNAKQAKDIAHLFDAGDAYNTCKNIWNFLKFEVPYKVEPASKQTTKTLSKIIYDAKYNTGKNDCKHYSNFTGAILDCLNIPFVYRFAGYSNYSNLPTHVYCVAYPGKNEIIIDAVLNYFDTEKPYKIKTDKKMALYQLSGIEGDFIAGKKKKKSSKVLNSIKKVAKKVGNNVTKVAKVVKQGAATAGLSIPRNAFLLLLKFNVHGWATGLKNKNFDQLKWWKDFGGNRTELQKAIKEGASKKRILGIDSQDFLFDAQIGEPVSIAAALTSATPIIVKVSSVLAEAEKASNQIEKITAPATKTLAAVNQAKQGFEKLTGKKVEDIIFRKEAGKSTGQNALTTKDFGKPTNEEAMQLAKAATSGGGLQTNKLLLIGGAGLLAAILLMRKK